MPLKDGGSRSPYGVMPLNKGAIAVKSDDFGAGIKLKHGRVLRGCAVRSRADPECTGRRLNSVVSLLEEFRGNARLIGRAMLSLLMN